MTNRNNFLDNLLGKKEAGDVRKTLTKATAALDAAKVTRKELIRRWKQEGDAAALVAVVTDTVVGALAESGAVEAIVASPDTEEQTPEEVKTQVEEAVIAAVDAVVEEVTVTPEAAEAVATAETETAPSDMAEMKSLVKSLGEMISGQTEDNGLIAKAVVDMAEAFKELSNDNTKLRGELAAIKKAIGDRPRQASKSVETILDDDEKASEIQSKIKEGLEGETTFLGVKVKPVANGNGNGKRS